MRCTKKRHVIRRVTYAHLCLRIAKRQCSVPITTNPRAIRLAWNKTSSAPGVYRTRRSSAIALFLFFKSACCILYAVWIGLMMSKVVRLIDSSSGKCGKVTPFSARSPPSMWSSRLLLLLPPPHCQRTMLRGGHHCPSQTPAHIVAFGASWSARGTSFDWLYASTRPFNPLITSSVAQIWVTAVNWFVRSTL